MPGPCSPGCRQPRAEDTVAQKAATRGSRGYPYFGCGAASNTSPAVLCHTGNYQQCARALQHTRGWLHSGLARATGAVLCADWRPHHSTAGCLLPGSDRPRQRRSNRQNSQRRSRVSLGLAVHAPLLASGLASSRPFRHRATAVHAQPVASVIEPADGFKRTSVRRALAAASTGLGNDRTRPGWSPRRRDPAGNRRPADLAGELRLARPTDLSSSSRTSSRRLRAATLFNRPTPPVPVPIGHCSLRHRTYRPSPVLPDQPARSTRARCCARN